ncbi:hypothetical protein DSM107133_02638 [Pseudosulfitobacter sp. DSM 107133]|nr:hypothetical protein DSM107133_02638 [Pseudosulfitobacter sp. DSM 107133]
MTSGPYADVVCRSGEGRLRGHSDLATEGSARPSRQRRADCRWRTFGATGGRALPGGATHLDSGLWWTSASSRQPNLDPHRAQRLLWVTCTHAEWLRPKPPGQFFISVHMDHGKPVKKGGAARSECETGFYPCMSEPFRYDAACAPLVLWDAGRVDGPNRRVLQRGQGCRRRVKVA